MGANTLDGLKVKGKASGLKPLEVGDGGKSPFERKRIGILGGAFDPPHLGHLLMAEQVGTQLELDEVWFMPSAVSPVKGKVSSSDKHRLEMINLAIYDNPKFRLQTYEIDRGGVNYTVDTLEHFVKEYPTYDFYFIIGTDSVNSLPTWKEPERAMELAQFVGIKRPGEWIYTNNYPIIWLDTPAVDISSTEIRLRVYFGQSIKYQVQDTVEAYIYKHGLYID